MFCSKKCYSSSNKGVKRNPQIGKKISKKLTGRKLSIQHRKKLSKVRIGKRWTDGQRIKFMKYLNTNGHPMKGKTHTKKARRKISCAMKRKTGKDSHNWRGGITAKDKLERHKFQRIIQKQVFERDNYTCQMCDTRGGYLQVDHIQSWADYVELRFSMDNCRTLCMDCHYFITFGKKRPDNVIWGHNLSKTERVRVQS